MGRCVAFVFDLDGTLCDTEAIHAVAESMLLAEHRVQLRPEDISRAYAGLPLERYVLDLVRDGTTLASLTARLNALVAEVVQERGIHPVPGMPDLVAALARRGVHRAVASSSSRAWIERCLDAPFHLSGQLRSYREYFGAQYVSGTEVAHPKPAPDLLLEAQRRVRAAAGVADDSVRWIAVGDSRADAACALEAGMEILLLGRPEGLPVDERIRTFPSTDALHAHVGALLDERPTPQR